MKIKVLVASILLINMSSPAVSKIDFDKMTNFVGSSQKSEKTSDNDDIRNELAAEAARLDLFRQWFELMFGLKITRNEKQKIQISELEILPRAYGYFDYALQSLAASLPRQLSDGSVEISAKVYLDPKKSSLKPPYLIQHESIDSGIIGLTSSCQVYLLGKQGNLIVKKELPFKFVSRTVINIKEFLTESDNIHYSFCPKMETQPTEWGAYVQIERVEGEVTSWVLESQNRKVSKESLIVFNQAIYTHPEAIQAARQWLQQGKTSIAAQLLGALPVASIPHDLRAYLPSQLAVSQHRTALVIGNANYTKSPLKNPLNDARALAQSLRQVGFEVIYKENLPTRGKMLEAMREFGASIKTDSTALFFYAGHAVQIDRENYLLPTQLDPTDKDQLKDDAVSIHRVLEEMERKGGIKILMLDACRDNPFGSKTRSLSQSRGLTVTEPPRNTVIMYATKADQTAEDSLAGTQHSPFTYALIENLKKPGVSLQDLFASIQEQVDESTKGKQTPALYTEMKMSTLKKWSLY